MTIGLQAVANITAMVTGAPEWEANEAEAKSVADPLVRLMDHYAVVPPVEVVLAMNLATAMIGYAAPRVVLMNFRKAQERAERDRNMKPVYDSTRQPDNGSDLTGATFGGAAPGSGMAN